MHQRHAPTKWKHFCYVHATESNLLDLPLEELRGLSEEAGYPVNAVAFVLEAMHRAETLNDAGDVCFAVVKAARGAWGESCREVLSAWGIRERQDIGIIVIGLDDVGLFPRGTIISREAFDAPFTLADMLRVPF